MTTRDFDTIADAVIDVVKHALDHRVAPLEASVKALLARVQEQNERLLELEAQRAADHVAR